MGEQVKRYDGQMMLGGTAIAAGFKTGMVTGQDFDALRRQVEALRAENARLTEALRIAHHNLAVGIDTEAALTGQLVAARGLLKRGADALAGRMCSDCSDDSCCMAPVRLSVWEIRTFLGLNRPAPRPDCPRGYGHGGAWCGPDTNCWLDPRPRGRR